MSTCYAQVRRVLVNYSELAATFLQSPSEALARGVGGAAFTISLGPQHAQLGHHDISPVQHGSCPL